MNPQGIENPATEKAYLNIRELSARTGLSVSTIHRLKNNGRIPCHQPSGKHGRLLFPPDAIEYASVAENQKHASRDGATPRCHLSGRQPAWMQSNNTPQEI